MASDDGGSAAAGSGSTPAVAGGRSRPRRGWLVGAVLLVVALLAVVVVRAWPRDQPDVVIVGDSVTFLSAPSIIQELDGRFDLVFRATPGYRSADLVGPFEDAIDEQVDAGRRLETAVVIVGYNDVLRHDTDFTGLNRMVELSRRFDCAIWFQLPATPGGEPAGDPDLDPAEVDRWNERVADRAEGHGNIHVVASWAEAVNAAAPDALLDTDGVHPKEAGQAVLAELVARAIDDECPD